MHGHLDRQLEPGALAVDLHQHIRAGCGERDLRPGDDPGLQQLGEQFRLELRVAF